MQMDYPGTLSRETAERLAQRLRDYPLVGPAQNIWPSSWLLEHSPWLQEKPRIKIYVSMKTGTVFWFERADSRMRPVHG